MYHKIASILTARLEKEKMLDPAKHDCYAYGFELMISYFCYFAILFIISIITCTIWQSVLFCIGFMTLRRCAGGFHADSYTKCHLLFSLNYLLFIAFYYFFPAKYDSWLIVLSSIFCLFVIWLFAPIEHMNRPFNDAERHCFKRRSRIYSCIIVSVSLVSLQFPILHSFLLCYLYGVFSASCSTVAGYIQQSRKQPQI